MKIENIIALITGGAARIGRAIALHLAQKGARIALHYYSNTSQAETTFKELITIQPDSLLLRGDIRQRADWENMRQAILQRWGRIDILINNAAIFYRTPFFDIQDEDWDNFLNTNLKGIFLGSQIMGKVMVEQKSGKIINIADVSAETIWKDYIPYCVSKAGVLALTRGLAKALAPYVLVNAISPGTVLLAENYDAQEENRLIERTPLKRIGTPEDIARTVEFLIEGSDFITGAVIPVDGGRRLT